MNVKYVFFRASRTGRQICGVVCIFASILFVKAVNADTWYVSSGSGDDILHAGAGWSDAFATIGKALTESALGDTILVSNDVYQLSGSLGVSGGRILRSFGADGKPDRDGTILRGDFPNTPFRCLYISGAGTVVEGFTVTNGWQEYDGSYDSVMGGGVYVVGGGSLVDCRVTGNYLETRNHNATQGGGGIYIGNATVSNCLIIGNVVTNISPHNTSGGGGVLIYNTDAWLVDSVVKHNTSTNPANLSYGMGGGVVLRQGNIKGCLVVSNNASGMGGGVYMNFKDTGNATMRDTTNAHNFTVSTGGGVRINSSPATGPYEFDNVVFYGNTSLNQGGGIYAGNHATFNHCRFENNTGYYGGGAYIIASAISISNCVFRGNTLEHPTGHAYGGALFLSGDGGTMSHCCFKENSAITENPGASAVGGAIYLGGTGWLVRNCLFHGNKAHGTHATSGGLGGALYIPGAKTNIIESCTIAGNYARVEGGGVRLISTGGDIVRNSIVYGNTNELGVSDLTLGSEARKDDVTYTCASEADGTWPTSNIAGPPLFVNPVENDYRLQANSPCINAGLNQGWMTNAVDLDGYPRLDRFSRHVDMGCHERVPRGMLFRSW